jgi:spoIIIJ-associated protein
MSSRTGRRYFWGNSLAQAVARAARLHEVAPEELAYRQIEKRHGFLKHPRRYLIEVDPEAPRRGASRPGASEPPRPTPPSSPPAPRPSAPAAGASGRAAAAEPERPPVRERRPPPPGEAPAPPDEDSALAAAVAMGRLLRFAGLELETRVERLADRLELRLEGRDEARLRALGAGLLDDLGHLLPRLVRALSGRQVLCRLDGAGLREAREEELRALAREAAEKVLATGAAVDLEPLPAAERRIVHLCLGDDPRFATESLGQGEKKAIRVSPTAAS